MTENTFQVVETRRFSVASLCLVGVWLVPGVWELPPTKFRQDLESFEADNRHIFSFALGSTQTA
jgi:hypothetical protein